MIMARLLERVGDLKSCPAGERVTFRARALRVWEAGGLRMALVGDESALTRVELGDVLVEEGASYEFRDAEVREYPGGWHSAGLDTGGAAVRLTQDVPISQGDAYIERTFKILAGIQRKKARREGRAPAWTHPADGEGRSR
jgi:hypothetical protein